MSHHSLLKNAIRLATAVALLVSVMISPIRPAPRASGSSQSDCFRRIFCIPSKATTNHRPHIPATSRIVQVKAVSSESKLHWMTPPAHHASALADSLSSSIGAERYSSDLSIDRAIHPLRC
jgi:hypothetical protein